MVGIDPGSINYLAVLAAGIVAWILGGVWYAPSVFGRKWMDLAKVGETETQQGGRVAMGIVLVLSVVTALFLAFVLQAMGAASIVDGVLVGLLVWFGFMAVPAVSGIVFEKRPPALYGINQAYAAVALVLMGIILTAWV